MLKQNQIGFFGNEISHKIEAFNFKLSDALIIIKKNKSAIANIVLKAIESKNVTIKSFYQLEQYQYNDLKNEILRDYGEKLPEFSCLTITAIKKIEIAFEGTTYDNEIYISSMLDLNTFASTIVHEISHFLNITLTEFEAKYYCNEFVEYCNEVRAYIAEESFNKNGEPLSSMDLNKIHARVKEKYPEYFLPDITTEQLGFIPSVYKI